MTEWIDAAEAARRLGVKPATLYAYVSRGVLRRRHAPDRRASLFDAAEVEVLARRGRPRRPAAAAGELPIESQISVLGEDRPYYRGRDALSLAESRRFEEVARWLWTGTEDEHRAPGDATAPKKAGGEGGWRADTGAVTAAMRAQAALPGRLLPLERLQIATAVLAASDPLRFTLDAPAVAETGRRLIGGLVDSLPAPPGAPPAPGESVGARLWRALCPRRPTPGLLRALEAALVLLAEHELAASTLAARVAASVRADPYAVVSAGLGVLGGPLHGGASLGAERMLRENDRPELAAGPIGDRLRRHERIPGFGHTVYKSGDGRMRLLYGLVTRAVSEGEGDPRRAEVAEAVLAESAARRLPEPNVDFALATLTTVAGMVTGAGEAIFAVARSAGWLAHAMEEYARGVPLRPRVTYTGPPPS
ncbi:citrate synthase [Thermocatellispora tengchongensis]|uniref:citrate synthase (unknown stereospecificity) n=1 Tax=Thermocatellispora tengchongensis TaxID=1073253 RepID=A0A840PAS3_9ACTN|nr:citrate/2-methylcitrate synthase [Thermocatellispora tengchongensis]MBB5134297.1 citrate synthase [Thermocatellispora tengchongensis]